MKTNTKLVVDLMNSSPHGALMQAFVIEAISRYAEQLVANPLPESRASLFNPPAWNDCALYAKRAIEENFK